MGRPPVEDVIEIEQLLARYAVGMTKDDIESVMDVFTPDGTYSAFGDTYRSVDFPAPGRRRPQRAVPGRAHRLSSSTATSGPASSRLCFVEGSFDICAARGLCGSQGVLIPRANVQHLMLREDVVKACAGDDSPSIRSPPSTRGSRC